MFSPDFIDFVNEFVYIYIYLFDDKSLLIKFDYPKVR